MSSAELQPPERVACSGIAFPLQRLAERAPLAPADRHALQTLRRFLLRDTEIGGMFGRHRRWHLAVRRPREIAFVAGSLRDATVAVVERRRRSWRLQQIGGCDALRTLRGRLEAASWSLDASAPPPGPEARRISVFVSETGCTSGRPPTGRVLRPRVAVDGDRMVITLFVRPLPGPQTCPAILPTTPTTIDLPVPVAGRRLFDGGTYPAVAAPSFAPAWPPPASG